MQEGFAFLEREREGEGERERERERERVRERETECVCILLRPAGVSRAFCGNLCLGTWVYSGLHFYGF